MTHILEQLEIDQTFFYIFGIFLVFYFLISKFYLIPFQKLIEKRNKKLNEEGAQIGELLKNVEDKLHEYQKLIDQTKTEARLSFEKSITEAKAKEDQEITKVRDQLKSDYAQYSQKLINEKSKIENELKLQAGSLAEGIALKVLGEK